MVKGDRSNLERLLHSSWEKHTAMPRNSKPASGNSRQRRFLRRLYEESLFSDHRPEQETLRSWFSKPTNKALLVVAVIGIVFTVLDKPYWLAAIGCVFLLLLLNLVLSLPTVRKNLPRVGRIMAFLLILGIATPYFSKWAAIYEKEHTTWCYGFFFLPVGPDGSPAKAMSFAIAAATFDNATNVTAQLYDMNDPCAHSTNPPPGWACGDYYPGMETDIPTIPIIYSYKRRVGEQVFTPLLHPYLAGAVPTSLSFMSKLGTRYVVLVRTGNGIDVREEITLRDKSNPWQCVTVTRIGDGKVLVKNYSPQYDEFGGRTIPVSCGSVSH